MTSFVGRSVVGALGRRPPVLQGEGEQQSFEETDVGPDLLSGEFGIRRRGRSHDR